MANCSHRLMQCAMGLLLGMVFLLAGNGRADGSVKFSVTGDDGKPVTDAVITLGGVTQAAGNYTFEPATDGRKAYRVTRKGYDPVGGQYCVVDYQGKPLCVDVVMQVEDDVDLSDVFWYNQNIFCKFVDGTLSMSLDHGRSYSHSIDLSAIASDSSRCQDPVDLQRPLTVLCRPDPAVSIPTTGRLTMNRRFSALTANLSFPIPAIITSPACRTMSIDRLSATGNSTCGAIIRPVLRLTTTSTSG